MTEPSLIIGYVASTSSMLAFGSQFYHTMKTKTTAGLSLPRTFFDTFSLGLWVLYATRVEDIPLLIATITELILSVGICIVIVRNRNHYRIKDITPPITPPGSTPRTSFDGDMVCTDVVVVVKERRNSV